MGDQGKDGPKLQQGNSSLDKKKNSLLRGCLGHLPEQAAQATEHQSMEIFKS